MNPRIPISAPKKKIRTLLAAAVAGAVAVGLAVAAGGFVVPELDGFPFPGRASDMPSGQHWYNKDLHGNAYDLTAIRYDDATDTWLRTHNSPAEYNPNPTNEDWVVHGKPVYAMAAGEVISCWRNAPENPVPWSPQVDDVAADGRKCCHPNSTQCDWDNPLPCTITRSGNHLNILTPDGKILNFSHLKTGSIPERLCPHDAAHMVDPSDRIGSYPAEAFIPEGSRPQVALGQRIAEVGNSGASSNPHLHVHVKDFIPPNQESNSFPLEFRDAWMAEHADLDILGDAAWQELDGDFLSNPPMMVHASPFLRRGSLARSAVLEVATAGLPSGLLVTAAREGNGELALSLVQQNADGSLALLDTEDTSYEASKLNVVHMGASIFGHDLVTAYREGDGDLRLRGWTVSMPIFGGSPHLNERSSKGAGAVSDVSLARHRAPDGERGVVTAVRDSHGDLKVIGWRVNAGASIITRAGDAGGEAATKMRVVSLPAGDFPGFPGVVVAYRNSDGDLRVRAYEVGDGLDSITPRGEDGGGEVWQVSLAPVEVFAGNDRMVVTAVRTADGNLKLSTWEIDPAGQVQRIANASAGGVQLVEIVPGNPGVPVWRDKVVTLVRDDDGDLRLLAWRVDNSGNLYRVGDIKAGGISDLAGTFVEKGGNQFLVGAFRDSGQDLKLISWQTNISL
ncbi:MAG: hypothetical protein AAGN66_11475 [Acidobacteriota bacterium]